MVRAIDTRNFTTNRATDTRMNELSRAASFVSERLPGSQTVTISALNSLTGTPNSLLTENAPSTEESLINQALNFVTQTSSSFGFAPNEPVEFVPDPTIETTSSQSKAVHLQQTYRGIPVFEMVRTVRFSPGNAISDVVGNNVNLPPEINIAPQIDVTQAVTSAAQYVATPNETEAMTDGWGQPMTPIRVDVSDYTPQVLVDFPLPSQPTVLDKGPFADLISAHLVLFYQNPETRLGWYVRIALPDYQDQYEVIVLADESSPEILYCQSLMQTVLGEGNVYKENPGTTPREIIPFPRNLNDYPVPQPSSLPPQFPGHWCTNDKCIGNNTIATLGNSSTTLQGMIQGEKIVFNPASGIGDDQKILNIFYFCNYMHDFFYMLGFNEAVGNFQDVNLTGQGTPNDPVEARAHSGAVRGTANMFTPPDGRRPVMNMGLVASTGRHTAFDADVVFHEFVHGVTNRLVGGRMNSRALEQPQSGGMGEGWSDYFALTIQNFGKPVEKVVTGDWVVNDPNGIRGLKYDSNFPDHFDKIGTGRYNQVHNIGEIWCATLMEMNRKVGEALESQDLGHQIGWQIVVDGLKLSPSNPSFLDERDAILKALDDLHTAGRLNGDDYSKVRKAVWTTFAKFGMGPSADCIAASLNGIVADFTVPAGL
ncbi:MAG: M36 family metallopeptidase [Pleurocapsa sp. MO_192.B19]|nr:M36 family metallopeptidase [Pleurocapsa sp. MO_192.B19]